MYPGKADGWNFYGEIFMKVSVGVGIMPLKRFLWTCIPS